MHFQMECQRRVVPQLFIHDRHFRIYTTIGTAPHKQPLSCCAIRTLFARRRPTANNRYTRRFSLFINRSHVSSTDGVGRTNGYRQDVEYGSQYNMYPRRDLYTVRILIPQIFRTAVTGPHVERASVRMYE